MFVALDFRFQLNCDKIPLMLNSHVSARFLNENIVVPFLLICVATGAHQALLLRRCEDNSVCGADHADIEGEKATPIDPDVKPFLLRYHDGLEDFGAVRSKWMLEQLHLVFDDGTMGYSTGYLHVMTPSGIWVQPWLHH